MLQFDEHEDAVGSTLFNDDMKGESHTVTIPKVDLKNTSHFDPGPCLLRIGVNTLRMRHLLWLVFFLWMAIPSAPAMAEAPEGWFTYRSGPFEVYSPEEKSRVALKLSARAQKSSKTIARRLGVDVGGPVQIYLPPTQRAFESMQPGTPPDWADATAYPSQGLIYLRPPRVRGQGDEPLEQVLDHELVHILLGRAFAPERPPSWLQEGAAQVLAGQYGPAAQKKQASKVIGASGMPLSQLETGFPADPHQASAAYALSADFVSWLQQQYGPDVLRRMVSDSRRGASFQRSVESATRTPMEILEKEWRATHARGSALWWSAVTSEESVWAYMGMLALFAVVIARYRVWRRTRRVIAEWREQEAWYDALWPGVWGRDRDVEAMKDALAEEGVTELVWQPEDIDADLDPTDPFGDGPR